MNVNLVSASGKDEEDDYESKGENGSSRKWGAAPNDTLFFFFVPPWTPPLQANVLTQLVMKQA